MRTGKPKRRFRRGEAGRNTASWLSEYLSDLPRPRPYLGVHIWNCWPKRLMFDAYLAVSYNERYRCWVEIIAEDNFL